MKFVIEFGEDDIEGIIEEFGDDIKESIKKRKKTALDSALAAYNDYRNRVRRKIEEDSSSIWYPVAEITFETKEEAEEILDRMYEILLRFDNVTVLDYYDLSAVTGCANDLNYGWTDLKDICVKATYKYGIVRWTIELPRPVRLHRYDQVK